MHRALALVALVALGCRSKDAEIANAGLDGTDADADGFPASVDCDDQDTEVNPAAIEVCDGKDNDCDGDVDEELTLPAWVDADGDGFGDPAGPTEVCALSAGFSTTGDDCDDADPDSFPGAPERCDTADNDCDGVTDEEVTTVWYRDADDDTQGDLLSPLDSCDPDPGWVANADDCDDADPTVGLGFAEVCDDQDNDCNGLSDEDPATWSQWYADLDLDSFGDPATSVAQCFAPEGWVGLEGDCDDTDPAVNPAAVEVCNGGIDDDCDGVADQVDADEDGAVDAACAGGDDCDDADPAISPLADEVWYDGVDQDCDGASDYDADADGVDALAHGGLDCVDDDPAYAPGALDTPYDGLDTDCGGDDDFDADGDGQRADTTSPAATYQGAVEVVAADAAAHTDCDDADASIFLGAPDAWYDGVDQDCAANDDFDADADGYRALTAGGADCDDADSAINPGAAELWYDGVDQDCSGGSDHDADSDGHDAPSGGGADCDDADPSVNPTAPEVCDDGVDQDCDGTSDGCTFSGDISVTEADAWYYGESDGDRLGQGDPGFASAGDVNGDGYDDLLTGAIYNDGAATDAGAAYVVFGPITAQGLTADTSDVILEGEAANDLAGRAVAGVGDVDADGYDDFVVSAQGNAAGGVNAGATYLISGPISAGTASLALSTAGGVSTAKVFGAEAGDLVADASWAGDINGDGYNDLLIASQYYDNGSTTDAGCATLIYGPLSGSYDLSTLRSGDARLIGENALDEAGSALWGAGDLDGDGIDDLLVAARFNDRAASNAGAVYVNFGPVSGSFNLSASDRVYTGEAASDELGFGASVSSAGDANSDGYADFIVGARYNGRGGFKAGSAYLVLGPITTGAATSLASASAIFVGETASDQTGDSVAGLGDIDGDGHDDLFIGSGWSSAGTYQGGAGYLLIGPVSAGVRDLSTADARFLPQTAGDRVRINAGGDFNADGLRDLLIGSQLNSSNGGPNARHGAVYLFSGKGL